MTSRSKFFLSYLATTAISILVYQHPAFAEGQASATAGENAISANELQYEETTEVFVAKGDVEVTHKENKVNADEISYDQKNGIVDARGSVQMKDPEIGEINASRVVLTEDLNQGTMTDVKGKFGDFSRFSAKEAVRHDEARLELEDASYSPCSLCEGAEEKAPLWQVSAGEVHIDDNEKRVSYRNMTFDVMGVPVLYTPYFSHALPGAKRESGFLAPTYKNVGDIGFTVSVPYYFNIAPNMDATLTPIMTSQEGPMAEGQFRHLLENGYYEFSGSITNPEERDLNNMRTGGHDLRGHIEGHGQFEFDRDWTAGFDGKRASDDTYLQRYRYGYEDLLTSEAYVNQVRGRDRIDVRAISFQGLNITDDPDTTPYVLPRVEAHWESDQWKYGSRFTLDASTLMLERSQGVDSQRISGEIGWELPYITNNGHVFNLRTSLRADGYNSDNTTGPGGRVDDGLVGRVIPEAYLKWSYPMVRPGDFAITFEPMVDLIASPNGNNPVRISNEDSQRGEITDINLFSNNRFAGLDRVEGGLRSNYGFRGAVSHEDYGDLSFLAGQAYHRNVDNNVTPASGMDGHFSDYVGRVVYGYGNTDIFYRWRMDKEDFKMHRNEAGVNMNLNRLQLGGSYVVLDEDDPAVTDRHEIRGNALFDITDEWGIYGEGRRNLRDEGHWVYTAAGLVFEGDCVKVQAEWNRDYTRTADVEPSSTYMLRIGLKNLGQ